MAYILGSDGAISVIDPKTRRIRDVIRAEEGATRIRFAPGGRYAFIVNTPKDLMRAEQYYASHPELRPTA